MHKARSDRYGQVGPSYIYDSPVNGPSAKTLSVTESSGNLPREYCAEGHASSANLLFQQSRQGQFSSPTGDGEFIPCNEGTSQMERKRKVPLFDEFMQCCYCCYLPSVTCPVCLFTKFILAD